MWLSWSWDTIFEAEKEGVEKKIKIYKILLGGFIEYLVYLTYIYIVKSVINW